MILNAEYDREKTNIELPIEEILGIIKGVESDYSSVLAKGVRGRITEVKSDHEKELAYMTFEELLQDEKDESFAAGKSIGKVEERAEVLKNLGISEAEYQRILDEKNKVQ